VRGGWQEKRLGDICEIIKGRKPALKVTQTKDDLPYLVAKVMRGSAEAEYASVKDKNSVVVDEPDTIIICDGSNSGEVFTGFRGILSSTMGKIATKAEIDGAYLRAFLDSTFDLFNGAKTGAAIPHLDKEAMFSLKFPFPTISEQAEIAKDLETLEAETQRLTRLYEQKIEALKSLKRSILHEAFSGNL
jgi:type I restriction enzyme S subunit